MPIDYAAGRTTMRDKVKRHDDKIILDAYEAATIISVAPP